MAERTLYFSARSAETSPNNGNEIVEVVGDVTGDPMLTPIRPRRILTGEESANSSHGASTTPNSPSYLRRNDLASDALNMEDVAEDDVRKADSPMIHSVCANLARITCNTHQNVANCLQIRANNAFNFSCKKRQKLPQL